MEPPIDNDIEDQVVPYARNIKLVDGLPTVVVEKGVVPGSKAQMNHLLDQALLLPYDGPDERFKGLSKGAAIIIEMVDQASKGDAGARKEVMDRLLGKSVQNINSFKVEGSVEDFLLGLGPAPGETIDVPSRTDSGEITDIPYREDITDQQAQAEADSL